MIKTIALLTSAAAMALLTISAHADERIMGYTHAELEAALPNLPKDELDQLVFRIPTMPQILHREEPISADGVDPFENIGMTRMQLAAKYPKMPSSEIDRLATYLQLIELRQAEN